MKKLGKQAVMGLLAAASVAAVATPAAARPYERYYRHHDDSGLALGIGILAVGAALAADRGYGYSYRDRPYYRGYYGAGYYRPYRTYRPYRGYWGPRCFTRRSWDYWGRPFLRRVCR